MRHRASHQNFAWPPTGRIRLLVDDMAQIIQAPWVGWSAVRQPIAPRATTLPFDCCKPKHLALMPHCSRAATSTSVTQANSMTAEASPQSPETGIGLATEEPGGPRREPELSSSMATRASDRAGCRHALVEPLCDLLANPGKKPPADEHPRAGVAAPSLGRWRDHQRELPDRRHS
jgi:hypothetical protein